MKLKPLIKKALKTKNKLDYYSKTKYLYYYHMWKVNDNEIVLESQHGDNLNGNIFYLAKQLNDDPDYQGYTCYLVYSKKGEAQFKRLVKKYKLNRMKLVRLGSLKYYQIMASAKYLINDTTFLPFFIKKDEQVYLNTWHGTPLKTLGKKVENDYHTIGNVQKNFFVSDYLLYPSDYMKEHMIEDYMLEHLYDKEIVLAGYPRNSIFYHDVSQREIRKELDLEDKEIFVYMPTYRGKVGKVEKAKQNSFITEQLMYIEENLKENQVFYVNLHPFVRNDIDFKQFSKIKAFPSQYETYEFLSIADTLITDYSSVFFDYAVTRRKVILFTYDEEEYLADRGMYLDMKDLPFTKVTTKEELIAIMNLEKGYEDEVFLETYCKYENVYASKDLLDLLLFNKRDRVKVERLEDDGKEKVLLYAGNLAKNGITTSLRNLLNHVDLQDKHYYITFNSAKIAPYKEVLRQLPEGVNYIATTGKMNASLMQKYKLFKFRTNKLPMKHFERDMKDLYRADYLRHYGNIHFDHVIMFNGYEFRKILLYSQAHTHRIIYVHNDMVKEIESRNNQHLETLKYAYASYDKVGVVTEDMIAPTSQICPVERDYHVVNNFINDQDVLDKSKLELEFDEDTTCTIEFDQLKAILESDSKKFITIGRYSPEKGHERLIKAFDRFVKEHEDAYLIIVGGHGNAYKKTLDLVKSLECKDRIILIRSMSNPYKLLSMCDYFVLSSLYEGFGLVIAEADIVGLPVISPEIEGPTTFMKENGGTLVEDSEDGIYEGMKLLIQDQVKVMNVDYDTYNQHALKQFYALLDDHYASKN